ESNNEYWLEKDAKLRTDFNITTGFQTDDIPRIKFKSKMKEYYEKAGLTVARYHLVDDLEGCRAFIEKVGYPVVAKPDNGVGASHNFKIKNDAELESFYGQRHEGVVYIMEEFVNGIVNSYDAIIDSKGEIMFETGNISLGSIMDIVNEKQNSKFYILKELPEDTRKAGRDTVKAFGVKSRFVHFEFFRLLEDQEGLGKKGDIMALEVNMRPSGGVSPDMINFAHNTDVYKIWADMVAFDYSTKPEGAHTYCGFIGLRDGKPFAMTHEDIMEKYSGQIKMSERVPDALSGAMGNQMYLATFPTEEELMAFYDDISREI
ncbi:MAG: ATP-grasp domain-containing protein, partial [Bacillota bacterium]|nr:ATP-grasp domain-containing protein [Bacillota bacterium]